MVKVYFHLPLPAMYLYRRQGRNILICHRWNPQGVVERGCPRIYAICLDRHANSAIAERVNRP